MLILPFFTGRISSIPLLMGKVLFYEVDCGWVEEAGASLIYENNS